MDITLKELLGIAATMVGMATGLQIYAMRKKKARNEELNLELAAVMQRLDRIEEDLQRFEQERRKTDDTMKDYGSKIDTLVSQVTNMNNLLEKLLDIQLKERK